MEEIKQEQPQNTQGGDSNKERKKFDENMLKLTAIVGSEEVIHGRIKISGDQTEVAVAEFLKEEQTEVTTKFKAGLKALINESIEYEKFCKEKDKEVEKSKMEKQKNFNKKADDLFKMISGFQERIKEWVSALKRVSTDEPPADITIKEATGD